MTSVRVFQLVLLLVLVLVCMVGRSVLTSLDVRHVKMQGKERYVVPTAASANAPLVPVLVIAVICLLLPWALDGLFPAVVNDPVMQYAWVLTLLGWVLMVPCVLLILFNLGKRVAVEKGTATFYLLFLARQTVKIEELATVKERFRRHKAGVLPVYQCVYDVYVKGEGGEAKKVYTLSNGIGGLRFLKDCAASNKVEWKDTTPKGYSRNPLIYPSLEQPALPRNVGHQELYLLTIPNLLTRQMINNNLPG